MMGWLYLLVAGLLEVGWATGLKASDGLSRPLPTAITAVAMVGSVVFLAFALKTLPLSIAYAVWTGIGIVGVTIVAIAFQGEALDAFKAGCLILIVAGIVGLKLIV
jgi:quaternary ammonium compound-resistance protein SugE